MAVSTALRSVERPRRTLQYVCGALGRAPCIHGHLHRLVTRECEKCALAIFLFFPPSLLWQESIEPVVQPIPFSHKLHVEVLEMGCELCHPAARSGASAGLPAASDCLACHQRSTPENPALEKLFEYSRSGKPIPWERIYRVPYYVFFNHKNHAEAKIDCAVCHGEVQKRDLLRKEKDLSMDTCVECHLKTAASVECHFCHELNQ